MAYNTIYRIYTYIDVALYNMSNWVDVLKLSVTLLRCMDTIVIVLIQKHQYKNKHYATYSMILTRLMKNCWVDQTELLSMYSD